MGTKKPFLQNTIKKCQVIGCPNEATYYIMANHGISIILGVEYAKTAYPNHV